MFFHSFAAMNSAEILNEAAEVSFSTEDRESAQALQPGLVQPRCAAT